MSKKAEEKDIKPSPQNQPKHPPKPKPGPTTGPLKGGLAVLGVLVIGLGFAQYQQFNALRDLESTQTNQPQSASQTLAPIQQAQQALVARVLEMEQITQQHKQSLDTLQQEFARLEQTMALMPKQAQSESAQAETFNQWQNTQAIEAAKYLYTIKDYTSLSQLLTSMARQVSNQKSQQALQQIINNIADYQNKQQVWLEGLDAIQQSLFALSWTDMPKSQEEAPQREDLTRQDNSSTWQKRWAQAKSEFKDLVKVRRRNTEADVLKMLSAQQLALVKAQFLYSFDELRWAIQQQNVKQLSEKAQALLTRLEVLFDVNAPEIQQIKQQLTGLIEEITTSASPSFDIDELYVLSQQG